MTNGSFSSKLTEALLRTQREGTAPEQRAASSNSTAPGPTDGNSTSVPPPSSSPPPPSRPVYEPETDIERLVLDFRAAPEKYVRLLDQHAPLPAGVGTLLEKVAERVKGLSVEDAAVPGTSRNDPLIDATIFFVAKVLMGPGADHYRVLGLNSDALVEDVHNHYRWLRRIFAVTEQNDRGQTVVMRISEAYVMLRDVERRRDYDRHKLGRSGHLHMKDATSKSFSPSFVDLPSSRNTVRNARQKKRTKPSLVIAVGMVVAAVVILLNREPPPPPSDPDDALVNSAPPVSSPEPVSDTLGTDAARVTPTKPEAAQTDSQVTLNTPPAESNEAEVSGRPPTSASDAALLQEVEKLAGAATAPQSAATPPNTINQPANDNTVASVGGPPSVGTAPEAGVPAAPPAPDAQAMARQQEIQRLLAYGKLLVDEMQLTQPAGRNAYEVYQQVLALDPQNEGAHQGLLSIVQRYIGIVRGRMQTKRYDEAVELADKGLAIQPSNEQLRVLRALAAEKASQVLVPATAFSPEGAAVPQRDVGDPGPAARDQAVPPSVSASAPSADSIAPQPPQSQPQPSSNQVASVPPEPDRAATPPLGNETPSAPTPSGGGLAIIPVLPSPGEVPVAPSSSSSSAPPEMPIATPGAQGSALGISEAALQTFINEFVRAYERGELEPFMALFAEGARTNNQVSKSGIRDDYEKLFESTTSRLMRVRDVRWSFDASSAIGEGDYSLTVLKKNESRPRSYEGSLTFQLVKRDGQLQIKGLYHSQRKITQ